MNERIDSLAMKKQVTQLYCFAHAGGNSGVFRHWQKSLPADIQVRSVELPGRGIKHGTPPIGDYSTLTRVLAAELVADFRAAQCERPELRYAIFGHSAGSRFGFAVAAVMERELGQAPVRCFLSGTSPPSTACGESVSTHLNEDQWIAKIRALGGTPDEVLAEPELMRFLLPILRADFCASEGARIDVGLILNCPFTLIAAKDDKAVSPSLVWEWARHTTGKSRQVLIQGDHFSVLSNPQVFPEIQADLQGESLTRVQGA